MRFCIILIIAGTLAGCKIGCVESRDGYCPPDPSVKLQDCVPYRPAGEPGYCGPYGPAGI